MLILTAGRPKKAIWGFFRLIPYLIGMGSVLFFFGFGFGFIFFGFGIDSLPHWNGFCFGASLGRSRC